MNRSASIRPSIEQRGNKLTAGTILVVDDEPANGEMVGRLLRREGYFVEIVHNGEAALELIRSSPPDVVLLDVMLPGITGFDVCRAIKADAATRLTPVIFLTGLDAHEHRMNGITAGGDEFLSKPFNIEELRARVRSLMTIKRFTDDLESAESVIMSLALTVEARDSYTHGHCQRLALFATTLGEELERSEDELAALRRGAYLHDVGKIGIPDAILLKPGKLTTDEFRFMQKHTTIGDALCGDMRSLAAVRPIIRHHHERLDGSGYPDGLVGDEIPLMAQIVGIVDAYDAMTTTRAYRAAMPSADACAELRADAERGKLDRLLVAAFVRMAELGVVAGLAASVDRNT